MRAVTIDTGGPDDVFAGALMTWMYTPRGGYGYTMPVDAKVIAHSRRPGTRVTIEVLKRSGDKVKRVVDVKNLRWRKP